MTERFNPMSIGWALAAVGPKKSEEIIRLTNFDSRAVWKRRPYAHELALVRAGFGLIEREGKIDKKFIDNMIFVLEWIKDLTPEQPPLINKIKGRVGPMFLDEESKRIISVEINNLRRNDRFASVGLSMTLTYFYRELEDFRILQSGSSPTEPLHFA
ncbi:hypothetical protein HZA76_02410 [Candidatus Roizmanbacteria bacterium]|nr:hypothetical protein [Candidatus Roizmanbacteria bacterium]